MDDKGNGGGAAPAWVEGGPVEGMSPAQAKDEIGKIENDPNFAGKGDMGHWPRQRMLKRRDSLYQRAIPLDPEREAAGDKGFYDALKAQGITKESLEADMEKFADRDLQEEIEKTQRALEVHFGGEKQAAMAILSARSVLKRFAKPADLKFLEDTGLGNDPELIKILVNLDQILKRGGKKK